MDVFDLRHRLVSDYRDYTRSFIRIRDPRIKGFVDDILDAEGFWPEPLLQLNPTFRPGGTIDDLVAEGVLHEECSHIFRAAKSDTDHRGRLLLLHRHQREAILQATAGRSCVLTTGTGSGKSLAYIVPIVDHVLRSGSGRGIRAIVVYPMNALANSQDEELGKFLCKGYPEGRPPVRFARYTGQERGAVREAIRSEPPDILLTNYMMLELLLTRSEDRALVRAAQGLRFLVFDELHTYRGRQGADVAMLIRRCRHAFGNGVASGDGIASGNGGASGNGIASGAGVAFGNGVTLDDGVVCIGTSATMASGGGSEDQRREVATVSQSLFGVDFTPGQVIGETLERATPEIDPADPAVRDAIRKAVVSDEEPPADYESFRAHPLASWIESTFGVREEAGAGKLVRQTPRRLGGDGESIGRDHGESGGGRPPSAASMLAALVGAGPERCAEVLRRWLLHGSGLYRSESSRFSIFAFRLHQFLTRGDTVWASLEPEAYRHLEIAKKAAKPGEPDKPLFPLVFCRHCGTAYYRVRVARPAMDAHDRATTLLPREDRREADDDGGHDAYLYLSEEAPWPRAAGSTLLDRLPDALKEKTAQGLERVRPNARNDVPQPVFVDSTGHLVPEGAGTPAALIHGNFLFCLEPSCGVAYTRSQRSERFKLATLGVDNRSTATTILAVRSLIELQHNRSLTPEARKLLSFTDNRQDASLQAGHFNDFVQVALLRSALYRACEGRRLARSPGETAAQNRGRPDQRRGQAENEGLAPVVAAGALSRDRRRDGTRFVPNEGADDSASGPGLRHGELSHHVFDAMNLRFEDYAADPEVRGPARQSTQDALRRVLEYFLYRDLERGWRVTAPNLEDCGLLRFEYEGLGGEDGLLAETELWESGFSVREGRAGRRFVEVPAALRLAPADVREEIIRTLLDLLRRSLAVKVDVLDPQKQRDLAEQTKQRLLEGTVWHLDDERDLTSAVVAWPRPGRRGGERGGLFVSSYGAYGQYVKRALAPHLPHLPSAPPFGRAETDEVIRFLFLALKRYGIVEQVRSGRGARPHMPEAGGDDPGYQLNADALRWLPGDGEDRPLDRTRLLEEGGLPAEVNRYFVECYRRFADLRYVLEAREHTAQVMPEDRQEREERFRAGTLPLLFCSPTMELGVDIAQLNLVNLRNVPPTPANYAQRSGRAGRGGQPALVFTYCAGRSPHDQYFYREPARMVAGTVAPPRIDLRNRDLVRSHVHAMWMEAARPDLGRTLTTVLDLDLDPATGTLPLPVKRALADELRSPAHRGRARARAEAVIAEIRPELERTAWFHADWVDEVLDRIERSFDAACERWRSLYRAAVRQRELHHRIIGDHSRPESERNHSARLRAQAESQIRLLTEAEGVYEGDFYSWRYFATEGFLPGYNFPRLPISAYVPGRRRRKGRDEFISRPRFLAVSEFGPRALIYHEGARYRVSRVNLDFGSDAIEDTHRLATDTMKRCERCGYAHLQAGEAHLAEVCDRCGDALDTPSRIDHLVRMQNVSLRHAQRITCDEEERQRFGYHLVTAYRFPEVNGRLDRKDAEVRADGACVLTLSYGDATDLYRVNLGWSHQDGSQPHGFNLDLERGYWSRNQADAEDRDDAAAEGRIARVVPFVRDTRNALVMRFEPARAAPETASLQAAFKQAIQQHFQLEPRELSCEAMPSPRERREILFYEASEGGAGVLRQLAEAPAVLPALARRALAICHYDPGTGEDRAADRCGRACYECLLDYGNQPDHRILDRALIRDLLTDLSRAECRPAGGAGSRSERLAALRKRCDSRLEQRWLDMVESLGLRLPSDAQYAIPGHHTRPDFFYREANAAIYVDGPPHDAPAQAREDEAKTRALIEAGYIVIRFHHGADWRAVFRRHADLFGAPNE